VEGGGFSGDQRRLGALGREVVVASNRVVYREDILVLVRPAMPGSQFYNNYSTEM